MNSDEVCPQSTCRRCGLCVTACPVEAIIFDGINPPRIGPDCIDCGLCRELCTGLAVDRDLLTPEDLLPEAIDGPLGRSVGLLTSRARSTALRAHGASGGAVTALCAAMLESDRADAIVGAAMSSANPTRAETVIANSVEELKGLAGSCYQTVPHGRVIPELDSLGRSVYIGLPCHIQALRKAQAKGMARNVALALGLFCGYNLEPAAADFLVAKLARSGERPIRVRFRDGDWPGGFSVDWDSGRRSFIAKDDYALCDALFLPRFCDYCVDLAAELADLSFGDAWYKPGGWTSVLVRTTRGRRAIQQAETEGKLEVEPAVMADLLITQAHTITHKKGTSGQRLAALPVRERPEFKGYGVKPTGGSTIVDRLEPIAVRAARRFFEIAPLGWFVVTSRLSRRLALFLRTDKDGRDRD